MPVELEFNYEKVTADMDIFSQSDIDILRDWVQKLDKSKCVPKDLTDKQLVTFCMACYGDIEKTKTCIEKYYSGKKNSPEFFNNRVLHSEEMKQAAEVIESIFFTGKSCKGYEVVFHRLHDSEPSKLCLEAACKLLFMTVDLNLSRKGPQLGYLVLFDMSGVKLAHLMRVNITSLRKFFQFVQEALPVRMRAIHVLNAEPLLDKILMLVKPFMSKEMYDMIEIHSKYESLEKLYEIIPKTSLPSDYGGTLPDTQTLHKQNLEQLRLLEPFFKAEEEQRMAAIPDKVINTFEGSFKKLDID